MFVDVRSFTTFAERLRPIEVVATLNRLFERIVPLVHRHGGHVDKYAGDGLFAVFGAPRRHLDHADRALTAALELSDAVRDEFGTALSVGVGLNSGTGGCRQCWWRRTIGVLGDRRRRQRRRAGRVGYPSDR